MELIQREIRFRERAVGSVSLRTLEFPEAPEVNLIFAFPDQNLTSNLGVWGWLAEYAFGQILHERRFQTLVLGRVYVKRGPQSFLTPEQKKNLGQNLLTEICEEMENVLGQLIVVTDQG